MCSVSWETRGPDQWTIFFNRDESKDRAEALPPAVFRGGEAAYLCPIDAERGGTWLAANEKGLAVGLLNHYRVPWDDSVPASSRGQLVRKLAEAPALDALPEWIRRETAGRLCPPFTLLAWQGERVQKFHWDTRRLTRGRLDLPFITSSSWQSSRVEKWRRNLFIEKVLQGGWAREKFHRLVVPGQEASSVCMTRDNAQTVSLTICRIAPGLVKMEYFPRGANGPFGAAASCELKF